MTRMIGNAYFINTHLEIYHCIILIDRIANLYSHPVGGAWDYSLSEIWWITEQWWLLGGAMDKLRTGGWGLIHRGMNKITDILQMTFSNPFSYMNSFAIKYYLMFSLYFHWKYVVIGLGSGLPSDRLEAITWTTEPMLMFIYVDRWHHRVSLLV